MPGLGTIRPSRGRAYDHAMAVDVVTSVEIDRPRAEVAGFAADPDNATAWYANIKTVEWLTSPPLAVGSQLASSPRSWGDGWPTPTRCSSTCPARG